MTRFLPAVLIVLLSCWTGGDPLGRDEFSQCSEMGCDDRLNLTFERRDMEAFPPGIYTFTLAPDKSDTLKFTCSLEDKKLKSCSGDYGSLSLEVDSDAYEITVMFHFAPQSISVTLEFSSQLLGDKTIVPDYNIVTPNGPNCEPTCFQASVTTEVSAPSGL